MSFVDMIKNTQSYTTTLNGAVAYNNTGDALLDLFASAGALRKRKADDIVSMFGKAMVEDKALATKLAFYTRDVREGLGERRSGRLMLAYLAKYYPNIFAKNAALIAEYGRYDDLVYLVDYAPETIVPLLYEQLIQDIQNKKAGESISLLAKWLPSINASNADTIKKGKYLAKCFGMSEKQYRKTLSDLRAYLDVVEVKMSNDRFDQIDYGSVPSKAMNNYRKAFLRQDEERFNAYLAQVAKGKANINASVLYPYDIVEKYLNGDPYDEVLEAQWKALPDYVDGDKRFLVMADVSGSMYGRPMATSVSLAIYFAQRNKGPFANTFMTFSNRPELVTLKGENLFEQVRYVSNADWAMNTNVEAAFDLILKTAVKNRVSKEVLPTSIVIISDMEFDRCSNPDWTFYDTMKAKYQSYGYELPNIVFWNVNSIKNTYQASFDRKGVQLASGSSATVFASLTEGKDMTPYDYMCSVLNAKRYEPISV